MQLLSISQSKKFVIRRFLPAAGRRVLTLSEFVHPVAPSRDMKTTIAIEGINCYAYHGCLEEEGKIGGEYRVDVSIEKDVEKAVLNDSLADTVDYVLVNNIVKAQMAIRSKLIEHVGGRILKALAEAIPGKKSIELKIIKFNPPVNGAIGQTYVILKEEYL